MDVGSASFNALSGVETGTTRETLDGDRGCVKKCTLFVCVCVPSVCVCVCVCVPSVVLPRGDEPEGPRSSHA